jgi:RimJ/RimL family protein N-acetyltransferase
MKLSLATVYEEDGRPHQTFMKYLYELAKERNDPSINISFKAPTWEDHVKFVESHPYQAWFIVFDRDEGTYAGAIYLTKANEIGIFVRKDWQRKGIGLWAIEELMRRQGPRRYLANINPANTPGIKVFHRAGFHKHIQVTLENDTRR